jgi:hypothetical protein
MITLITRYRLPISAIEWEDMRQLALSLNPAVEDFLLTSRTTAMRYIEATYRCFVTQLALKLQSSRSIIHFSTDLWTSPQRCSMLAVCIQWVDAEYHLQKALLGLPECRISHSGEIQADLIVQTLNKYGIINIGYHTSDNATSNDTCLHVLARRWQSKHKVF